MEKGKHVAINPPVDVGRRSSGKARNDHIDTHLCCTYCTTDTQATVCRNTCKDCMEMRDITHIMTLNSQPTENETSTATITAVQVATEGQEEAEANTSPKPTSRPPKVQWSMTGPTQDPLIPKGPTRDPRTTVRPTQDPRPTTVPTHQPSSSEGPTRGPLTTPKPNTTARMKETQVFLDSGCLGSSYIREDIAHAIAKNTPHLFIPCITNVCGAFGQCE